jgi:hypothetical protein
LDHFTRARREERIAVAGDCSSEIGGNPGVFQLNARGYTMPAFSFEKISPPIRRGPIAPIGKKQRGVIVKILDRFVEARVKRTLRQEKGVIARRQKKSSD